MFVGWVHALRFQPLEIAAASSRCEVVHDIAAFGPKGELKRI
jgi:hypothetical protein